MSAESTTPPAASAAQPVSRPSAGGVVPLPADATLADQLRHGTIVVGVAAQPESNGPVLVAHGLEQRYDARVMAIQVIDISGVALPAPLPSAFAIARDLIGDAPYAEDVEARRRQFTELLGEPNEWSVHVALGTPAQEILRYAGQQTAAVIVIGLRRHGVVDRILRDETTLTVARRAQAAVLGVVPTLRGLPRTAVVGVDFGPASIRAARAALDVLARPEFGAPATLRLAYVDRAGVEGAREEPAGEARIRRLGVAAAFEELMQALGAPPEVRIDATVLYGNPGPALLAFATESNADLLAVGSLRHERLEQWILGSVTTEVVRDGRCSVLVVPPRHG